MLLEKKFTDEFDFDENLQIGINENNFFIIKQYEEDTMIHWYNSKEDKYSYRSLMFGNYTPDELVEYIKKEYSKGKSLEKIFKELKAKND